MASAPGTWVLIGENVDHFGGVTLAGTAALRAAAAVSPRPDRVVAVSARGPLGQEFSAQLPFDEEPADGLARRWLPDVPDAHVDAVLAGLAGYFVDVARRPDPPGLPTVRAFQRAQGVVVLGWLRRRWAAPGEPGR